MFAAHGIRGLLITTAVVGAGKIERALELARFAPDTIFIVESEQNVRDLSDAAGRFPGVEVNLAVDLHFGRTGISPGAPALDLTRFITRQPRVRFVGLQSYDGAAAHTAPFDARRTRTSGSMKQAVETRRMIERAGIACPLVTGGIDGHLPDQRRDRRRHRDPAGQLHLHGHGIRPDRRAGQHRLS